MKTIFFIFIFILISSFQYATIINVPEDQPTIQDGINAAADTDTVLVQPGTYFENINYYERLIIVASLFLITRETDYISQTIIDGYSNGHVVSFDHGEDSLAVLCGFTIKNGYAIGTFPLNTGGGIYCAGSSPSLENLQILENYAYNGAGIGCVFNSNPNISNVLIVQNEATNNGGAIFCGSSNPDIRNLTCSNNFALEGEGGAIYVTSIDSHLSLSNSILWGNYAFTSPEIFVESGVIDVTFTDVQGYWQGIGNLEVDPNFLDFINYELSILNFDGTAQNFCVDAGDPQDPIGNEPIPNGDRINMGVYGGTSQAAFSAHIDDPIIPQGTIYYPNYIHIFNDSPMVESGSDLQIEPGTVVILNGDFMFEIFGQINIGGATRNDSVFITSDISAYGGGPNQSDFWQGFIFVGALDSSTFNNVYIENAINGINLGSVSAYLDNTKIIYDDGNLIPSPGAGITIGDGSNSQITGSEISGYTIGIDIYNENLREITTPVLTNNRVRNSPESSRQDAVGLKIAGNVAATIDNCVIENYNHGIQYIGTGDIIPVRETPVLTNNRVRNSPESSRNDSLYVGIYLKNLINVEIDSCEVYEYLTGIEISNDTSTRALSTPILTNNRVRNSPESSRQEAIGIKITGYVAANIDNCDIEDYDNGIQYIGTGDTFPVRETPVLTNNRVRNSPESSRTYFLKGIYVDSLATIMIDNCDIEDYKTAIEIRNSNTGRVTSTPVLTNNRVRNSPESSRDILVGLRLSGDVFGMVENNEFVQCDSALVIIGNDTAALIQNNLIYLPEILANSTAIHASDAGDLTINDNTVYQYEYGLISVGTVINFFNNIFWHDSPTIEPVTIEPAFLTGTYNDISIPGGVLYPGIGNINSNPMFVDVVAEDFNLEWNSPCIDGGDLASPFDPDDTVNDIGLYYYYQPDYLETPTNLDFSLNAGNVDLNWDLVSGAIGYNIYTSFNPYSGWSLRDFNVRDLSWFGPIVGEKRFYFIKAYNSRSLSETLESYQKKNYLNLK